MYKSDGRAARILSVMIVFVLLAVGTAAASGAVSSDVAADKHSPVVTSCSTSFSTEKL